MVLTRHAETRRQQRAFSFQTMDIIQRYGRCEMVPGGAIRFFFGRKEHERAVRDLKGRAALTGGRKGRRRAGRRSIQMLDRAKGGAIVYKDGQVLTVYVHK
jgi:hypothetical protein